jgi:molybdopterin synthase catalytic subunit
MFSVTTSVVSTPSLIESIETASTGAVVTFEGRVRDHNLNRKVNALEYEVYRELAIKEGNSILNEARAKFKILNAIAVHRYGLLHIKDIAVSIVVVATHRDDAFLACSYIIDQIKTRVPIWKKEHYDLGDAQWVDCPTCAKRHKSHGGEHQWI